MLNIDKFSSKFFKSEHNEVKYLIKSVLEQNFHILWNVKLANEYYWGSFGLNIQCTLWKVHNIDSKVT